ncbi:MAG TPA: GAF domain-containing sensor histidine kinase, partial [Gemmatimonadaceae bacterium]|nr:GAF domain-containing sensor histidine kinase [Gemmatimonadaceae bacterium]
AIEGCLLEQQCGGALSFADLTTAVTSTTEARRDVALVRSDGSRVFLSVGARPTDRDATAAERKWVVTLTDVSARVRSAERRVQLQALTAALSRSMSREAVSEVVLHQALPAFGAAAGGVLLVDSEAEEFVALGLTGHPDDVNAHWQRFRLGAGIPADEIVRTGNPVVISSAAAWHSRFPNTAPLMAGMGLRSFHGVPVQIGGRVLGVLGLSFREEREPDAEEVELLATLGDQLAQALERVRLYEAQQAALAEAEAANRAKTQFLATMSHELRTPLNAIGGYADLMLAAVHGPLPDAYAEYARRLKSSQQHLLGLINAVLDFARVESGHVTYTVADVGLSDLLSDIQSMVEPQASARGLELSWETCDASLRVMGDAEKIRQILLNLLTNAIKFCESGDRITVACTAEGNHVAIQVSDTGPGIAADRLEHIFEPFVQGDTSRTRPSEGIGLGLAISRQLAEGLGGRLTVESEVGKGSVFTLQLNRVPD